MFIIIIFSQCINLYHTFFLQCWLQEVREETHEHGRIKDTAGKIKLYWKIHEKFGIDLDPDQSVKTPDSDQIVKKNRIQVCSDIYIAI